MREQGTHSSELCYCPADMEYLRGYESDSGSTDDEYHESQRDIEVDSTFKQGSTSGSGQPAVRQVYLITYSQCDLQKFPTRQSFAEAVVASFGHTNAEILQWVCCKECHSSGGYHYHMAIKLDRCQRWLASRRYLQEQHGISVNFSDSHHNYYSAWKYTTKEDNNVLESKDHPDLWNWKAPKTNAACSRNKKVRVSECSESDDERETHYTDSDGEESDNEGSGKPVKRKKRLSAFELSEIIIQKGIKTRTELLAFANAQKIEGKQDIAEFIVNRGPRVVCEVLNTAWEMTTAQEKLNRSKKSRLELLQDAAEGECVLGCEGQWQACARELLEQNGICKDAFTNAIKDLLENGRSKFRNLMICGPANSGKTFILNPLTSIYDTFCNPASTSFAWLGAENCECIFLNDFRWSAQVIQWHDFLLMLEGQMVHLPAPKTHYAKDIVFDKDTPIFCTSKQPIVYIRNGVLDQRETDMMSVRWKIFTFNVRIQEKDQRELSKCAKCFATFVLY